MKGETPEGRDVMQTLRRALEVVRSRYSDRPRAGLVLGTGLGSLATDLEVEVSIPYQEIPGFPWSTVESHEGRLVLGRLSGKPIAVLQGRVHRYEGYSLQEVVFPVRVLGLLGTEVVILTGAVGGMNPLMERGDLVLLDDHINLMGDNPLVGPNVDELGPRFPDMSEPYDRGLQKLALQVALEQGIRLQRGVYVAVPGPSLETRAEYRMLRAMGADVVGMSTVPEVIAARHMGLRVLALSVITDECFPDALEPVEVEAILRTAREAEPRLAAVIRGVISRL